MMPINSIFSSFITLILFVLMGCEKLPKLTQKIEDSIPIDQLLQSDTNKSKPEESAEVNPSKDNTAFEQPLKSIAPTPAKKTEINIKQVAKKVAKSVPLQPDFSPELLKIVQNWQRIPQSLLPFPSVIISSPTNLEVSSNGKVLASTPVQAGSEVTVIGLTGSTLTIAPPIPENTPRKLFRPRMIGTIDIDKTDFKQCVAYKYEMTLLAQKRHAEEKKSHTAEIIENKKEEIPKSKEVNDDPLAIPDPLDFGHGRFCICKDCREKRVAATGSLKAGHGLEP